MKKKKKKTFEVLRENVLSADIDRLRPFVRDNPEFYGAPGVEHYRLLAHLSTLFDGRTIVDIGTHKGDSALALSYNEDNTVETFDVVDRVDALHRLRSNITYHTENIFDEVVRNTHRRMLLDSAMILIDVDPHAGIQELDLVRWLERHEYQGLIVLDDIWFFKTMRDNIWYQIEGRYKKDLTHLGHWSGTGIVSFGEANVKHVAEANTSNWTLVTGYFDLTHMSDANTDIQTRPASHYLDNNANSTLALNQNLVIFCEPNTQDKIMSLRPSWLHKRTKLITMSFEEFPLTQYRDQIVKNRGGCCPTDKRNTASYYLFCMARYAMLKQVIEDNPFKSTHFAWINICIERMGYKNLIHLDEALAQQRKQFSTCYIDYVSKTSDDLAEYFGGSACIGRCSMCSGFFTGDHQHMKAVCDMVEEQFLRCLEAGYGHSDEQLIEFVHQEHPELFNWYCGDYGEMITNYAHVYDRAHVVIANLIKHSAEAKNWAVCERACKILLTSYTTGKCWLTDAEVTYLLDTMRHLGG